MAPKSALEVHEESWNAYPYTKTIFSVPYVEKFSIEIETKFEQDSGHQVRPLWCTVWGDALCDVSHPCLSQENIFQLSNSDLRQREVG